MERKNERKILPIVVIAVCRPVVKSSAIAELAELQPKKRKSSSCLSVPGATDTSCFLIGELEEIFNWNSCENFLSGTSASNEWETCALV